MTRYLLSDYNYHLPPALIAQEPLKQRDHSKMMVLSREKQTIASQSFSSLPLYLKKGDLLVLNNTRVIPARLKGVTKLGQKQAELLLIRKLRPARWLCMVRPGRHLKPGREVLLEEEVLAKIMGVTKEGLRVVEFEAPAPLEALLPKLGKMPLPPYITKTLKDPAQYQTVYASQDGSAAAPTAGFHFTSDTFATLEEMGVGTAFITLSIGPGTFQPVRTEDIREHAMHEEYFVIEEKVAEKINQVKEEGGRVVAVGTTVCRTLEAATENNGLVTAAQRSTRLFIYPGFKFRVVDALLTNFHLPHSSLLMLVSALAGHDFIMKSYQRAVAEKYRFFSFGDCMLIL